VHAAKQLRLAAAAASAQAQARNSGVASPRSVLVIQNTRSDEQLHHHSVRP